MKKRYLNLKKKDEGSVSLYFLLTKDLGLDLVITSNISDESILISVNKDNEISVTLAVLGIDDIKTLKECSIAEFKVENLIPPFNGEELVQSILEYLEVDKSVIGLKSLLVNKLMVEETEEEEKEMA
jgi:hypothetical protein